MKNTTPVITVDDAIYQLIHQSETPAKAQAEALGVSYSRLLNSCIESSETAYHHTRWIIPQTLMSRNFILIDFIERALGRVAVSVIKNNGKGRLQSRDLAAEVMAVAKEMGEMAWAIHEGLKKKTFSRDEAECCKKETWDLIIQAVKVYQEIEQMTE